MSTDRFYSSETSPEWEARRRGAAGMPGSKKAVGLPRYPHMSEILPMSNQIRVTHQAPGFREVEVARPWTTDTANAYVDTVSCVLGTSVRIYHGMTVVRTKVCDPR